LSKASRGYTSLLSDTQETTVMAYRFELWGSHRDAGNDDLITSGEWVSQDQAIADFEETMGKPFWQNRGWQQAVVVAQDGTIVKEIRRTLSKADDDEDDSEFAMQQGMGLGIDAYNEAKGYGP
jgi:hypothetical protein